MKPREFDELIRERFDQGDFEYNPASWEKLEGQMDRKATRRKILMWLPLAPVAYISSIAASLAMIITIPVLMQHHSTSGNDMPVKLANINTHPVQQSPVLQDNSNPVIVYNNNVQLIKQDEKNNSIHLSLNAFNNDIAANKSVKTWNKNINNSEMTRNDFNMAFADNNYNVNANTRANRLPLTISIIGGYNTGSGINGYSVGANGTKMINDRFYIEGDVTLVDNSGIQNKLDLSVSSASTAVYSIQIPDNNYSNYSNQAQSQTPNSTGNMATVQQNMAGGNSSVTVGYVDPKNVLRGARTTSDPTTPAPIQTTVPTPSMPSIHRIRYDLYYGQFAPAVGYHLHKNLSIGVGADVQRLLQGENSMSTSTSATTASDIAADNKLVPGFDIGLVGKTEVTLSDNIKASIYYRQGMNNVITPGNKYIDRSYLQLHLKFTLFKK